METSIGFDPPKRRHKDQQHSQFDEALGLAVKRQKISYPKGCELPPAFWDTLSTTPLTKAALKELDRRNAKALHPSSRRSSQRRRQPITRGAVAKWKSEHRLCESPPQPSNQQKRFAKLGGPDLTDLRGFQAAVNPLYSIMDSSQVSSPGTSRATKKTSPYDRAFGQNLIDHGIYPDEYDRPGRTSPPLPKNLQQINERLGQHRPSLTPSRFSDASFKKFKRQNAKAQKEKQVATSVIPLIEGEIGDSRCVAGGIPLTNFDHLTNGTIVPGNPDTYYGARPEQLDRRVRDKLNHLIVPSTDDSLPLSPNFFLEAKGPGGSTEVAQRQACYNGALGARSMHALQAFAEDEEAHDGNAYAISSIYQGGHLMMYATHRTQSKDPEDRPEFNMTLVDAWSMIGNRDSFEKGASAYRNLRDWAKEQRDAAIDGANSKVRKLADVPTSNASSVNPISSFATQEATQISNTEDETLQSFV